MKALVLMYHRVASPGMDPWGLCVSRERFSEHMEVLRRIAHPCTLSELVRAHAERSIPENAVAVTFDDGYLDNLTAAMPLLEEHDVPATIFVCSGALGCQQEFWWDQLQRILLQSPKKLPPRLELDVNGKRMVWSLEEHDRDQDSAVDTCDWRLNHALPHAVSHSLFYSIWEQLRILPPAAQGEAMRQMRLWSGTPDQAREDYRTFDVDTVLEVASSPLIEIGSHTLNHPLLPAHSREFQRLEISKDRSTLEDVVGDRVLHFAYPYGEYDLTTVDILREEGFASACTVLDRAVTEQSSAYELPRVTIADWTGEQFGRAIRERLSNADPRSGAFGVSLPGRQVGRSGTSETLVDKTVLIIHPAWYSCGRHAIFCSQTKAYKALGARVISLAVGTSMHQYPANQEFWSYYYAQTNDLHADTRFHTGPSTSAFLRLSLFPVLARYLFANSAQQKTMLAQISPIPPGLFDHDVALIHCNYHFNMPLALRLKAPRGVPILLETHNVQAKQCELQGAKALFRRASFEQLLQAELAQCEMADYLIHTNAQEVRFFSERVPGKPHALLNPPLADGAEMTASPSFFLIFATANYPNFIDVKWFLTEVFPLIPHVNVKIIGNIDREFRSRRPELYAKHQNIFIGEAINSIKYYEDAAAILIPAIDEYGLSIKAVEAMVTDKPIIATPKAFRGVDADWSHISKVQVVESATDFSRAVKAELNSATSKLSHKAEMPLAPKEQEAAATLRTSKQTLEEISFDKYLQALEEIIEQAIFQ